MSIEREFQKDLIVWIAAHQSFALCVVGTGG